MNTKNIIEILKLLNKYPIKSWQDLDEDASQNDVWQAQAEWIKAELDK